MFIDVPDDCLNTLTWPIPPVLMTYLDTGRFVIAGGYCRDQIRGRKPRDVDVYCLDDRPIPDGLEGLNVRWSPVQILTGRGTTIDGVLNDFDFACNMCAIGRRDGKWYGRCHSKWQEHTVKRLLFVPNTESAGLNAKTVVRLARLLDRGWKVAPGGLCDLPDATGHSE